MQQPLRAQQPDPAQTGTIATFQIGETVSVKRYGNAMVMSVVVDEPGHQYHGRVQVQYPDGSQYWARQETLRKFEQPPARILVTETTDHYRAAAQQFAHPDDVVLEVGSSHGVTCEMLHQRCRLVVGIDTSRELVEGARAKYPHIRFEVLDGFNVAALQSLSPTGSFDKIFIDIGGIELLHTVMALVGLYFRSFGRHTVLVVKSKYMKTLLQNAQVFVPQLELDQKARARQARMQHKQEQEQKQQQHQEPETVQGQQTQDQKQQQSSQQQPQQPQQPQLPPVQQASACLQQGLPALIAHAPCEQAQGSPCH